MRKPILVIIMASILSLSGFVNVSYATKPVAKKVARQAVEAVEAVVFTIASMQFSTIESCIKAGFSTQDCHQSAAKARKSKVRPFLPPDN